ncbi:Ig domain-containing protein [Serratia sp. NPDC078593]|uniref:Ig-like domain-containing protein n=1 Tax=unclassified Serratia (in: enterobacteria) TaxID=2647522 RepID=UPI0037D1749E
MPATGVTVAPTSGNVAVGATTTFKVNIAPVSATNKTYTVTSSDPTKATATLLGNTVTVTGVAVGSANITVKTADGAFTAVYVANITA